jgi:hypothetical protein
MPKCRNDAVKKQEVGVSCHNELADKQLRTKMLYFFYYYEGEQFSHQEAFDEKHDRFWVG